MAIRPRRSLTASFPAQITMVAAIGLFLLAVLRWREYGWSALAWLAAFAVTCAVRAPHSLRNRANVVVETRKDRTEVALLIGMFATMMVLPLVHLATDVLAFADYALPARATWIGVLAQIPFLWLFWRSHADLGRNWSPGLEVRDDHELVTTGVYGRVRHPMYAAILIAVLAQPLLIHNWIAGLLVVPAFAAMWFLRVPHEEALMRKRFGEAWDAYCIRAGRLFPKSRS